MVDAIDQVDAVGLQVLSALLRSANELGLADGRAEFDVPIHHLNSVQFAAIFPGFEDVIHPTLAILQRLGLIDARYNNQAVLGGGSETPADYTITGFGRDLLSEITAAREHLRDGGDA